MRPLIGQREPHGMRHDPSPSKWQYRYERWMLTPIYRRLIRTGLPVLMVSALVGIYVMDGDRRQAISDGYNDMVRSFQQRPEFMLSAMAVDGVDNETATAIRSVLNYNFPVSSFDLDLEEGRRRVEEVAVVERATLRIKPGGILQVLVTPRVPVAMWRQGEALHLVDASGRVIADVQSRGDRADLPLIAGDGAKDALTEAMSIFAAAGPVAPRVRGLVRMGERRWDVVLDRDQRILLPETDAVTSFERVVVMSQTQDLLERDVAVVDMRNKDRPTLRLGESGAAEMRRINADVSGAGN